MTCLPHLCNKELFNPLRVLQHTELQSQSGMPVLQGIQTGPKAKKSKVYQNKQVLVSSQSWYDPATSSSMSRRPWSVTRMRARPRFIYTQQDEPLQERQKYVWYPLTMYESITSISIYLALSLQHNIGQYGPSARASLHFEQPINCCVLGQQKQSQRPLHLAENLPEQCVYAALGCWWFRSQSLLPIELTTLRVSKRLSFVKLWTASN